MATYVMSDIHGEYDKYISMLEQIKFKDRDTLFVIGDIVDMGDKPISILLDMMERPNVYPVFGNHDYTALGLLRKIADADESAGLGGFDDETKELLIDWMHDGGKTTIEEFSRLDADTKESVLDYLSEFSLYEVIDIEDDTFILVHAGLGNFKKGKKLKEYTEEELLECRFDYGKKYFEDDSVYIITGHTPTFNLFGKSKIYINNNNICVDCGASYNDGRLACLCLDTFDEYYV